ncbi:NAD+ synthase/NAD+ synthase (glutamine-hydrolyzing) [Inhella inkyongensis]|uniref:Glutamine-dependent NAD(+) synthetase n=1 Tax=Inhella inkyongensis TaxID=392593 RepID=A0A840S783_9BURK|nr:NAD+ synthase [Inhella inkyongensis]MBB5204866.1 NAD+ synthase/NAD+ synthase (glutamine-hydrolyzing) [Inhella inkyongensis]
MLKLTIAQLNLTVGDVAGNVERMTAAARQAASEGAELVVFPELAVSGYYPGDLLDEPAFIRQVEAGLEALREASRGLPDLAWVFGTPLRRDGPGKKLENGLLVLRAGEVILRYAKQLLPTYNIFDERRHFEPGPDVAKVLRLGSVQVGLLICEDGWNDEAGDYRVNPFDRLRDAAPELVISLNASPSNIGKREQRHQVFGSASRRNGLPILYVNHVGGHDQLVYDGASFAVEPEDGVVFEADRFVESVRTLGFENGRFVELDGSRPSRPDPGGISPMAFYRAQIVLGLRDYARRCGFTQAVVGSSGGIDSALTLALATEALGAANVVGITMPSSFSSSGSVTDSEQLCRNLGIELLNHPIKGAVEAMKAQFADSFGAPMQGLTLENLQARVRGTVLMAYSNANGHLLLTTGNKSEVSVGYCTLYGDTNGGLGLIGDLYKTEVFELCRHLNEAAGRELVPAAIIEKEPSAELAPGQRDSDSLPPYPVLDDMLKVLIEGDRMASWEREAAEARMAGLRGTPEGRALIEKVARMIQRSEYKRRQAPPLIRLRGRAFGQGRQMPIAARYPGVFE